MLCALDRPVYGYINERERGASGWRWEFGDGSSSAGQNPSHLYASSGVYTVSLRVTDTLGCSSVLTKTDYITANARPAADFMAAPTSCCVPLTVYFTDTS
ncbi:MAG: PKD domain-containing protein, partial [Chloroflexi bacterium]|nr:PKD domain-containing protein [Chloroflexota bacterium]